MSNENTTAIGGGNTGGNAKPPLWTRNFVTCSAANFLLFFSFYQLLPILPLYIIDKFATDNATAGIIISLYTIGARMPPLRRVSRRYAQQKAAVLLDVLRVHSLLYRLQDGWAFADSCCCAICTWAFLWNFDNGKQYRRH